MQASPPSRPRPALPRAIPSSWGFALSPWVGTSAAAWQLVHRGKKKTFEASRNAAWAFFAFGLTWADAG